MNEDLLASQEALTRELTESLRARAQGVAEKVSDVRGGIPLSDKAAHELSDLVAAFPRVVFEAIDDELRDEHADPAVRATLAKSLIARTVKARQFIEDWLEGRAEFRQYVSLHRAVARECENLGLGTRHAILSPGVPHNFSTFVEDPYQTLFGALQKTVPEKLPERPERGFALVRVPRFEGSVPLWLPMILGHELAHLAVAHHETAQDIRDPSNDEWDQASQLDVPPWVHKRLSTPALTALDVITHWITESLCDAYAVRRFGPAGAVAVAEFLAVVGATDKLESSHPPGFLRTELMISWLPPIDDARLSAIVDPWRAVSAGIEPPPFARFLIDYVRQRASEIYDAVEGWSPEYDWDERRSTVHAISDLYLAGTPGTTHLEPMENQVALVTDSDAVNAAWIARHERGDVELPIERLAQKNLDSLEFVGQWLESGGSVAEIAAAEEIAGQVMDDEERPTLSAAEISDRLRRTDDSRLVVTPLVGDVLQGATLDVRLGNQFIVLQRSVATSFAPLDRSSDPRLMQTAIEKPWGEKIVLHPDELVLASTLEYLVLPGDLTAQVITRSSYGRLGLITATAIQIQPHFHGCLTLELVNVGQVPLEVMPGERVAQLVFHRTRYVDEPDTKYRYPTGPEFSRVREDDDSEVLRTIMESRL